MALLLRRRRERKREEEEEKRKRDEEREEEEEKLTGFDCEDLEEEREEREEKKNGDAKGEDFNEFRLQKISTAKDGRSTAISEASGVVLVFDDNHLTASPPPSPPPPLPLTRKEFHSRIHDKQTGAIFHTAFISLLFAAPFYIVETASLFLSAPEFKAETPAVGAVFFATFYALPVQSVLKAVIFFMDKELWRKSENQLRRRRLLEEAHGEL